MAPGFIIRNDYANFLDFRKLATIEDVRVDLVAHLNPSGAVSDGTVTLSGPTFHFSKLYNEDWQSPAAPLSAFERHISHIAESDYSQGTKDFSREGHYVALHMLQHWLSFDNRKDALILEATGPDANSAFVPLPRAAICQNGAKKESKYCIRRKKCCNYVGNLA